MEGMGGLWAVGIYDCGRMGCDAEYGYGNTGRIVHREGGMKVVKGTRSHVADNGGGRYPSERPELSNNGCTQ